MKQLHQKIEERKNAINVKRKHLSEDYIAAKRRLTSKGVSLTTIGGAIIGFMLLPKKLKILKGAFKLYTMAATVRQILDLIPHQPSTKKRVPHKYK